MELQDISGIGPRRLELFRQLNIETPTDLLRFYPKEYLDFSSITLIRDAEENQTVTLHVRAQSDPSVFYSKGKYIVSVRIADESGKATIRWINQPYRMQQVHAGDELYISGKANRKRGVVFYNPQINPSDPGIVPIYTVVKGLSQKLVRDTVAAVLSEAQITDVLPPEWLEQYGFPNAAGALRTVHQPVSKAELLLAKKRLSFEEALLYFLNVASAKDEQKRKNGFGFKTDDVEKTFLSSIPFKPTEAQMRVMHEVASDMQDPSPMNRLIQGDVGSGKTLIAQFALTVAVRNHKQGALLAPTSILAEQHFTNLKPYFPNACLFMGSFT